MRRTTKSLSHPTTDLVVSFDLEWTKDYKAPNSQMPFCFSFVCLPSKTDLGDLTEHMEFGFVSVYAERESETPVLIRMADQILGDLMNGQTTLVGQQLCTDIAILLARRGKRQFENFALLQKLWKTRKHDPWQSRMKVFDTRFDMDSSLVGKSRKLVHICEEYNLDVTQPEITSSMTRMHKDFLATQDCQIMEKLSVLNIRHSLSAALLYLFFQLGSKPEAKFNVNCILHRNLQSYFCYVKHVSFDRLIQKK